MQDKIKTWYLDIRKRFTKYGELRFSGQAIFVVIILLISWSGVRAIQSNYNLQQQISQLNQQNELANLQNQNINLQNQYYQSKQYLELSARENLGLAFAGETELLVPDNIASSYTVSEPSTNQPQTKQGRGSGGQKNYGAWIDFFMHRNNS